MNRFVRSILVVLLASMLVSCAGVTSTPADTNKMIEPGDMIGDFLVTTGDEEDVVYAFDQDCVKQGDKENYSCKSTVGTKVNITTGIYDLSGKLDEKWSRFTYQLFIEGRPVNLQSFPPIDVRHPVVSRIRFWNVAVTTSKPGSITTRDVGVIDGESVESTTTYTFSAP